MAELATVAGLVAGTGALISAGVLFGTRYIDRTLQPSSHDQNNRMPLVRQPHSALRGSDAA